MYSSKLDTETVDESEHSGPANSEDFKIFMSEKGTKQIQDGPQTDRSNRSLRKFGSPNIVNTDRSQRKRNNSVYSLSDQFTSRERQNTLKQQLSAREKNINIMNDKILSFDEDSYNYN